MSLTVFPLLYFASPWLFCDHQCEVPPLGSSALSCRPIDSLPPPPRTGICFHNSESWSWLFSWPGFPFPSLFKTQAFLSDSLLPRALTPAPVGINHFFLWFSSSLCSNSVALGTLSYYLSVFPAKQRHVFSFSVAPASGTVLACSKALDTGTRSKLKRSLAESESDQEKP